MTWKDGGEGKEGRFTRNPRRETARYRTHALDELPIDRSSLLARSATVCRPLSNEISPSGEGAGSERGESMGSGVNLPNDAASHITLYVLHARRRERVA